jgi:iron complex outermembrane receptor protein/vitamin B12 transporter
MSSVSGRSSARLVLRAASALAAFLLPAQLFSVRFAQLSLIFATLLISTTPARAVVVRGVVTDALGRPIPGARVQLIQGPRPVAIAIAGADGSFEIRSTLAGRFVLLTSAPAFYPGVGQDFYGGFTDQVAQNVVLETGSLQQQVTVTATGLPTPVAQSSAAVTLIPDSDLATSIGVIDALRQSPGVDVVQTGQAGGVTSLFVRGGNSDANMVLIDGIPANDVGGTFDFGPVSSTGLAGLELYRGPDSALYGTDAGASVLNIETPRGSATKPQIDYSGSAGNFHAYRNEIALSGARQKLDYYTAFSRFNTSNALPLDEYHSATSVANLGYNITANTQARLTLRNADSATGLPNAHDFYGLSADGRESDQDLYSGLTLENRLGDGWHNLVRYGISRKRVQERQFTNVGAPTTYNFGAVPCGSPAADCFTEYFGKAVTIRGANGYTATGQASFFVPTDDMDSNRDVLYYQSDYSFARSLTALFGFHYVNERGSYVEPAPYAEEEQTQRTNFEYTLQLQGQIKSRVFYSAGGGIEKNHLYGITGAPRIGLSYVPFFPGAKWFRGTLLRANVATGVQEPSLGIQFASLYTKLQEAGDSADIAKYHVTPAGPQRSRTYDLGVEQNIRGEKLVLKLGYFHNTFNHQLEGVDSGALEQIFGYSPSVAQAAYQPYLNSLAFRAQGFETELQYRPFARLFVRGGYTYLDAVVTQSFSSDAYYNGTYNNNPNLPGIAIGAEGPLIGARPFRRPPHTGFFAVEYTGNRLGAAFKGALASRSDDSTYLDGFDPNFGNSLVLPNRDLDFGYAKLDANLTYALKPRVTAFTELDNLLGQQHIGPIGYPGLPFTVRAGLKVRIGGD